MSETMTKERPILFSAAMIRALLAGRKSMTRRIVKPQPDPSWGVTSAGMISSGSDSDGEWSWLSGDTRDSDTWLVHGDPFRCPYGRVGDRLIVRESIYIQPEIWAEHRGPQPFHYAADIPREQVEDYVLKPSIHMPRWASRITLEITGVRVERVEDITEDDAIAEGFEESFDSAGGCFERTTARENFLHLFYDINGRAARGSNQLVWVLDFKRVELGNE